MSITKRLFETVTDMYGYERNVLGEELMYEVKDAWRAKYGEPIEETLGISGVDVESIFRLVPEILIRWELEDDPQEGGRNEPAQSGGRGGVSYGDHIDYNTGQKCDCSLAISGGHYRGRA